MEELLKDIFTSRYGDVSKCPRCHHRFSYYRITGRKIFSCSWCGRQISPLTGTIFYKSSTSLYKWFTGLDVMRQTKGEMSIMELKRVLEVSLPCARRMYYLLKPRLALYQDYDTALLMLFQAVPYLTRDSHKWSKFNITLSRETGYYIPSGRVPMVKPKKNVFNDPWDCGRCRSSKGLCRLHKALAAEGKVPVIYRQY